MFIGNRQRMFISVVLSLKVIVIEMNAMPLTRGPCVHSLNGAQSPIKDKLPSKSLEK